MALQLFDHAKTEDGLLARVIQNVDANQAGEELLAFSGLDFCQLHKELSIIDIEGRLYQAKLNPLFLSMSARPRGIRLTVRQQLGLLDRESPEWQ